MAEEEKTDKTEETPDASEAPAAEETTEAPAAEETTEAPAAEETPEPPAAEETPEAPAAETTEAAPQAAAAPAHAREPQEVVAPKERRRRARAAKAAKVPSRGSVTGEERHDERLAERRKKAEHRRAGRVKARAKASHDGAATTPPREHAPGVQKVRQGVVVSDKADKTITVRIDTARRHRRYEKIVRTSRTLHAHDERNDAHTGDTVIVREARPLSRTKRWRLVQVVERAK
jgi:small subunit ribosomal protein S17